MAGSHLCIPRNETARPHYFQNRIIMSCLPVPIHSYICERFIYFQYRSVYFAAAKYADRSWKFINRSQTHEGRAIPFLGVHKFLFWEYINAIFGTVWERLATIRSYFLSSLYNSHSHSRARSLFLYHSLHTVSQSLILISPSFSLTTFLDNLFTCVV